MTFFSSFRDKFTTVRRAHSGFPKDGLAASAPEEDACKSHIGFAPQRTLVRDAYSIHEPVSSENHLHFYRIKQSTEGLSRGDPITGEWDFLKDFSSDLELELAARIVFPRDITPNGFFWVQACRTTFVAVCKKALAQREYGLTCLTKRLKNLTTNEILDCLQTNAAEHQLFAIKTLLFVTASELGEVDDFLLPFSLSRWLDENDLRPETLLISGGNPAVSLEGRLVEAWIDRACTSHPHFRQYGAIEIIHFYPNGPVEEAMDQHSRDTHSDLSCVTRTPVLNGPIAELTTGLQVGTHEVMMFFTGIRLLLTATLAAVGVIGLIGAIIWVQTYLTPPKKMQPTEWLRPIPEEDQTYPRAPN